MPCLNPSACTSLYSNGPHEFSFLTIPIHIHETHHQHRMIAKQKEKNPIISRRQFPWLTQSDHATEFPVNLNSYQVANELLSLRDKN